MTRIRQPQQADGLYDERYEHDACGVAVVARLDNIPSHEVVRLGIEAVANLEHRGAAGADPETGDGAGLLLQMPDEFLREIAGFELPPPGSYGVAMCFLPTDPGEQVELTTLLERIAVEEGQVVLGWREEQEHKLPRPGMSDAELAVFVQSYERLTRHIQAEMPSRADVVVRLGRDRSVRNVAWVNPYPAIRPSACG